MSRFVLSLLIFVVISYGVGQYAGSLVDKYDFPVHSWSWWSVRGIRDMVQKQSPVPNTILLGSSLMVVAIAEGDATWSGERLDLTTYRKARYLDALLAVSDARERPYGSIESVGHEDFNTSPFLDSSGDHKLIASTVNLASPGQIVSDAYLTLKEALNEGMKPELVVYGIAPRDFIDSTMESPTDTECYRYVSRLVSSDEIDVFLSNGVVSSFWRNLIRVLPLSGKALDIQQKCIKTASDWSDSALRNKMAVKAMPLEKRMAILSTYEPLDMVPGFIHAEVAHREDIDKQYCDNLADYMARYRRPKATFYDGQLNCLSRLIDLCKRNRIELVVVDMPIRKSNVDLLDSRIYNELKADVARRINDKGAIYRDLCDFASYEQTDYRDSVHLNGFGGMKFTRQLADVIGETRRSLLQEASGLRGNP